MSGKTLIYNFIGSTCCIRSCSLTVMLGRLQLFIRNLSPDGIDHIDSVSREMHVRRASPATRQPDVHVHARAAPRDARWTQAGVCGRQQRGRQGEGGRGSLATSDNTGFTSVWWQVSGFVDDFLTDVDDMNLSRFHEYRYDLLTPSIY